MAKYRRVEVGKYYKSRNPDNTYIYFEVTGIDNYVKITVLKDLDTIEARSFRKRDVVFLPKCSDMLITSRCSNPISREEILAVMI